MTRSKLKFLLSDRKFQGLSADEGSVIVGRILSDIKGRMMEDIVLLETEIADPKKQVFQLQFDVGEFDKVIADEESLTCEVYEIDENNFYVQYRKYKANENADGRCNVVDERIKTLQISALSRINFCFKELKSNPPMKWENNVLDEDSIEISIQNYKNLSRGEQVVFKETLYKYLNRESTVEARTMLIINYLAALLIEGRNNQISIHKNFENKISEIRKFEAENQVTLYNLKSARDKLYAHIDLDWQKYAKSITFDEFEICIKFLNDLFDYRVFE